MAKGLSKNIFWFLFNGIFGIFLIYFFNIFLYEIGFNIGINTITILISTFLGIPGIFMLYGISFFI